TGARRGIQVQRQRLVHPERGRIYQELPADATRGKEAFLRHHRGYGDCGLPKYPGGVLSGTRRSRGGWRVRRVRWFEAAWPFSMRTLASHLKEYTFLPESDDGFILHRARDRAIEGAYFERVSLDEVVRDPFGNEKTFQHIVYRDVEFLFSSDYPHVELRKFPRTIHAFLSRVSEAAEFRVAFVPLRIDVFDWAKRVQRAYPQRFRLDLAQLSDLFLEDTVSA